MQPHSAQPRPLQVALEKSNVRTTELYRELDPKQKGAVEKVDFMTVMHGLGVKSDDAELGVIFHIWETDSSGTLDFKGLDRVLRTAKSKRHSTRVSSTSAMDIQKALNERLQGRVKGDADKKPDKKANKFQRGKSTIKLEKDKEVEEVAEYEETGDELEGTWAASKWINSLHDIPKAILRALQMPSAAVQPAFDFMRKINVEEVSSRLEEAKLGGLTNIMLTALMELKKQTVSGSAQLNDKFQMSYGSLSLFYGGLESLLGPPQMTKEHQGEEAIASLFKSMENDHCAMADSNELFDTPNGMTSKSCIEWEVVVDPKPQPAGLSETELYPERSGWRQSNPEWCRKLVPLATLMEDMKNNCNMQLAKDGHSEVIKEELVGGRLYTGPMYAKYNAVLRSKSKVPFLVEQGKKLTRGNSYVTTIHAINS